MKIKNKSQNGKNRALSLDKNGMEKNLREFFYWHILQRLCILS